MKRAVFIIMFVVVLAGASHLLAGLFFSAGLLDYTPAWSDDVEYFQETSAVAVRGLEAGYFSIQERPAHIGRSGPHGPAFPVLYGLMGRVLGWYNYSAPLFNIFFMSLGFSFLVYIARLNALEIIFSGLIVICFWPVLFYLPSNMQESLHQAGAIALAGLYLRQGAGGRRHIYGAFALIIVLSLFRPTWAFAALPFTFIALDGALLKRKLPIAFAIFLCVSVLAFYIYSLWAAPYPNFISELSAAIGSSPMLAIMALLLNAKANVADFISPFNGFWIEVLQRYAVLAVVIVSAFRMSKAGAYGFALMSLMPMLLFAGFFYEVSDFKDYRLLAPVLLMAVLALSISNKRMLPLLIMLAMLLSAPQFLNAYRQNHAGHFVDYSQAQAHFNDTITKHIIYDSVNEPWCNSILLDARSLQFYLTGLEPGIGINYVLRWQDVAFPIKSKYLFIGGDVYGFVRDMAHLRPVSGSLFGTLYVNEDAACIMPDNISTLH